MAGPLNFDIAHSTATAFGAIQGASGAVNFGAHNVGSGSVTTSNENSASPSQNADTDATAAAKSPGVIGTIGAIAEEAGAWATRNPTFLVGIAVIIGAGVLLWGFITGRKKKH